jgi:DNA invertase Pin-like site-specific DNA recombinase
MTATLIGYARCSTDAQDLTAQRDRPRRRYSV